VQKGEWFYTSGEDRIFPKGFPVGAASSVKPGQFMKEIHLNLSGSPGSVDEVLVVIEGAHQQIPTTLPQQQTAKSLPPPPEDTPGGQQAPRLATEADKIKQRYQELGKQQNHTFGAIGSNLPNFNQRLQTDGQPESSGTGAASSAAKPVPEQKTTPVQEPPKTTPAPGPATPAPSSPSVLGARPQTRTETPAAKPKPPAPAVSQPAGPVLPLGAPRKKTSSPPAGDSGDSRP
jgi:hypothetical protein